jgi:hypothetical protein
MDLSEKPIPGGAAPNTQPADPPQRNDLALQGTASLANVVGATPTAAIDTVVVATSPRFPHNLPQKFELIRGQDGKAYSIRRDMGNPYLLAVGCRALNNAIRQAGRDEGLTLKQSAVSDVNHYLQAEADMAGCVADVWYRVAPVTGGIEIDLGDHTHFRVRITAGQVEIVTAGSEALFWRTASGRALCMPAEVGDIKLLKKYVNLDPMAHLLLTAWITWTIAHPKVSTSKFLILLLQGGQGTGKSFLTKLLLRLIDPSILGVQPLHSNPKDFAIAAQGAHVLGYDNLRHLTHSMADLLCTAATGGTISTRQLYTDSDQNVMHLLVALILNGIHAFADQPDLVQRCLPLRLETIDENNRKSEADLAVELEADLPAILRGLYDLIAQILAQLPNARVTSPTRMLDFSKWLAAMELVIEAPEGAYQEEYCEALNQGQRDALLDSLLAAAVLEFAEDQKGESWTGTPAQLHNLLCIRATPGTQRSREWPQNAIALSKRLLPLQAGLLTQGVDVELGRGKERTVTITYKK